MKYFIASLNEYKNSEPVNTDIKDKLIKLLDGKNRKLFKKNVLIIKDGNNYILKIYETNVVTINASGDIIIDFGKWATPFTFRTIKEVTGLELSTSKGKQYLNYLGKQILLPEGYVKIYLDGYLSLKK